MELWRRWPRAGGATGHGCYEPDVEAPARDPAIRLRARCPAARMTVPRRRPAAAKRFISYLLPNGR